MIYSDADFKNLPFNPMCSGKILTTYPVLKEITNGLEAKQMDEYVRYTIMLCEPKSVLVATERDLTDRKKSAAQIAGIAFKTEQEESDFFTYKDEIAFELTVRYLTRFCKSKEFSAIMAFENCYEESIRLLMKPIEEKVSGVQIKDKEILDAVQKKSAIKNEISQDLARINNLYEEFFGEDMELTKKATGRLTSENIRDRKGRK